MKFSDIINPVSEGLHFYGWGYIINELKKTINFSEDGLTIHAFTDCVFWSDHKRVLPETDWIGFVHSAVGGQPGRKQQYNIDNLLNHPSFIDALDQCKALVVLTDHTRNYLRKQVNIPVLKVDHPKFYAGKMFDIDRYMSNPKLRHSGFELRDVARFFTTPTSMPKEMHIGQQHNYDLVKWELVHHGVSPSACGVNVIYEFLDNQQYSEQLISTIGFSCYYDCAASNAVLEHIMSHSPLVVNRIPPIVEYLGEDYPMYYGNISHNLDQYLLDKSFVQQTSDYLKQQSQRKEFKIEHFCEFVNQL